MQKVSKSGKKLPTEPYYKQVKEWVLHCPKCNERLLGNGSENLPYSCNCGVWVKEWAESEWKLMPTKTIRVDSLKQFKKLIKKLD